MQRVIIIIIVLAAIGYGLKYAAFDLKIDKPNDQVLAYFEIFKEVYWDTTAMNTEMKYVAINLDTVKGADKQALTDMISQYCYDNAMTFLDMNFEELKAQGYATDTDFREGFLISFYDTTLTDKQLVSGATKWRSTSQYVTGIYSVQKKFWFIKVRNVRNKQVIE